MTARGKKYSELELLKEDIERAISHCVVERTKVRNEGKSLDEIYSLAEKEIDSWKVHSTDLAPSEEYEYVFTIRAERLGLMIGRMGEQFEAFRKAIKKECGVEVMTNLKEEKRSNLYSSIDGYYLLRDYARMEEKDFVEFCDSL